MPIVDTTECPQTVTSAATPGGSDPLRRTRAARRIGSPAFVRVVVVVIALALSYVAYQRLSVTANADRVTRFETWSDETVEIGMTDQQPGFVLLALTPPEKTRVEASNHDNWLTGRKTVITAHSPAHTQSAALRAPLVVLVDRAGTIDFVPVAWSKAEFDELVHAADCETDCKAHAHRCGAPLDAIAHALGGWPTERVPRPIARFLSERVR